MTTNKDHSRTIWNLMAITCIRWLAINWMIRNLYLGNGWFTKHPLKTGCFGFQVAKTCMPVIMDWGSNAGSNEVMKLKIPSQNGIMDHCHCHAESLFDFCWGGFLCSSVALSILIFGIFPIIPRHQWSGHFFWGGNRSATITTIWDDPRGVDVRYNLEKRNHHLHPPTGSLSIGHPRYSLIIHRSNSRKTNPPQKKNPLNVVHPWTCKPTIIHPNHSTQIEFNP